MAGLWVGDGLDIHRVNEAEVDDVDGDLGVEDVAELGPDGFRVGGGPGCSGGFGGRRGGDLLAEGVGIGAVNPEETKVGLHGIGAAECLVNHHRRAGVERGLVARGNLGGDDFAGEDAVTVGHGEKGERRGRKKRTEEWPTEHTEYTEEKRTEEAEMRRSFRACGGCRGRKIIS